MDLVAYVLIRNDLPSLTPGKAAAQVHHAGVQMMIKYANHQLVKDYVRLGTEQGADGFNTTLTLSANLAQIEAAIGKVRHLDAVCDILVDPTYPFFVDPEVAPFLEANAAMKRVGPTSNGKELFLRNELTCAWALGDRNDTIFKSVFESLPLY